MSADPVWDADKNHWTLPFTFESQPALFAEDCPHCMGSGYWGITGERICTACRGSGIA